MISNRNEIIKNYKVIIQSLTDTSNLDIENAKLQNEYEVITELLGKCLEENASTALDQSEYNERYTALAERYEAIKRQINEVDNKSMERNAKRENIEEFIQRLKQNNKLLTEFDEELWNSIIEKVVVHTDNEIDFVFKDVMEIKTNI